MNLYEYINRTQIISEGGAGGHMFHPFDLPGVNTGRDLIKVFEKSIQSLKDTPGALKIDGVNASIKLINVNNRKQFALDRGSGKFLDINGVTKDNLVDRFGKGHGMIAVGAKVLDIFDEALPAITHDLEQLGMLDDNTILFNMEYVSGRTNVQEYDKNFLAIHGLLKAENIETSKTLKSGAVKTSARRTIKEIPYNQGVLNDLVVKLQPIAKKYGFEVYGSVPTTFSREPDINIPLRQTYTIERMNKRETKTLKQWLGTVQQIPKINRVKMMVNGVATDKGAVSKDVYFAVFSNQVLDDLFTNPDDIEVAINGAVTYLATEKLGDEILSNLDSPMGSVNNHEGVVIRDPNISSVPFKITGKFITAGVSSQFGR